MKKLNILFIMFLLCVSTVFAYTEGKASIESITFDKESWNYGEPITGKAVFYTPKQDATFIIEAGAIPSAGQAYTILDDAPIIAKESFCDSNTHYASWLFTNPNDGRLSTLQFTVQPYVTEGDQRMIFGIYNGCAADEGESFYIYAEQFKTVNINPRCPEGQNYIDGKCSTYVCPTGSEYSSAVGTCIPANSCPTGYKKSSANVCVKATCADGSQSDIDGNCISGGDKSDYSKNQSKGFFANLSTQALTLLILGSALIAGGWYASSINPYFILIAVLGAITIVVGLLL